MISLDKRQCGFEEVSFVAKARSKDPAREVLHNIQITPERICATDGRRLHFTKNSFDLETGLYQVVKATKSQVLLVPADSTNQFPDVDKVIPIANGLQTVEGNHISVSYTFLVLKCHIKSRGLITINFDYFKDLWESSEYWEYEVTSKEIVYLSNGTKTAVIMGLRKNKERA